MNRDDDDDDDGDRTKYFDGPRPKRFTRDREREIVLMYIVPGNLSASGHMLSVRTVVLYYYRI